MFSIVFRICLACLLYHMLVLFSPKLCMISHCSKNLVLLFFCRKIFCFLFFFCHILKSVFLLAFDTHICIVVCCVLLYCCFAVRSCIVCEFTFVATLFCIVCTFKLLAHAVASFANLHFLLLHCLCIYRFATHCCIICEFTFIPRVVTLFASLLFFFSHNRYSIWLLQLPRYAIRSLL